MGENRVCGGGIWDSDKCLPVNQQTFHLLFAPLLEKVRSGEYLFKTLKRKILDW